VGQSFRDADSRSYAQIDGRVVSWDAISVDHQDEVVRRGGHIFAAVARAAFLTPFAERLRNAVGIPIMVGGHPVSDNERNTILAGGRADFCIVSQLGDVGMLARMGGA
jgi:hypothetical protein